MTQCCFFQNTQTSLKGMTKSRRVKLDIGVYLTIKSPLHYNKNTITDEVITIWSGDLISEVVILGYTNCGAFLHFRNTGAVLYARTKHYPVFITKWARVFLEMLR